MGIVHVNASVWFNSARLYFSQALTRTSAQAAVVEAFDGSSCSPEKASLAYCSTSTIQKYVLKTYFCFVAFFGHKILNNEHLIVLRRGLYTIKYSECLGIISYSCGFKSTGAIFPPGVILTISPSSSLFPQWIAIAKGSLFSGIILRIVDTVREVAGATFIHLRPPPVASFILTHDPVVCVTM